jgi:two-component system chemotaxis response regulator CheB
MIVDDSAVVRGLVSRWIEEESELEVVARHANGRLAVEDVARSAPDIVLLDIEMPVMDGLEALPLLLGERPELRVLMVSTLTRRNAEISFKALALGALDYVPKPDSNREITTSLDFRREVVRKIKMLGRVRMQRTSVNDGAAPTVAGGAALGEARARPLAFKQRPFPSCRRASSRSAVRPAALRRWQAFSARRRPRFPAFPSSWRSTCRRCSPGSSPSVWRAPRGARRGKGSKVRRSGLAESMWRLGTTI